MTHYGGKKKRSQPNFEQTRKRKAFKQLQIDVLVPKKVSKPVSTKDLFPLSNQCDLLVELQEVPEVGKDKMDR